LDPGYGTFVRDKVKGWIILERYRFREVAFDKCELAVMREKGRIP
jgi:hypothetical protein